MRIAAAALVALLMSAPLMAQEPAPAPSPEADPAVDAFFQFHDTDGNDRVSLDEVVARVRTMFTELRKADEKQKAEIWKANEQLVTSKQFACADANNSMMLARYEWRAYLDQSAKDPALKPGIVQTATLARLEFHETGYDANEDDAWSRAEAKDIAEAEFKKLDADNDQSVSLSEFIAARGVLLRQQYKYSEADFEKRSDPLSLYRTLGCKWTQKSEYSFANMTHVSTISNEIVSVSLEEAEVRMVMLDDKGKELFNNSYKIPLKLSTPAGGKVGGAMLPNFKMEERPNETVKVAAGEFECIVVETEFSGNKSTTHMSCRFPGLMVKMTLAGEGMTSQMELTEFIEHPPAPDERALYVKGRSWTTKVTVKEGDKEEVHFEKCVVVEVTSSEARMDVTTLDKDMKETDKPVTRRNRVFDAVAPGSGIAGRVTLKKLEKLSVHAGEFEAVSESREDGAETLVVSVHAKLAGLTLKSVYTTEKTTRTVELWEFKE
ncbi:MAG: hypothetical protein IT462_02805 [Planctomycetes bacterium]|nr:hypothetical protein [Planctomycetota bacterium]